MLNPLQSPLPPGSVIGILGGGQLGRMTALAAARLGYRCHVFSPEDDAPAAQVSWRTTVADWRDEQALARFAGDCDVVTYEFENIPTVAAASVARHVPLRPAADVLATCQDRITEKRFLGAHRRADRALEAGLERGRPASGRRRNRLPGGIEVGSAGL